MSFILDALKKSETDRQQRTSSEFAGVPASGDRAGAPRWLWALRALLAINLVLLLALFLRPSEAPATSPSTGVTGPQNAAANASIRSAAAHSETAVVDATRGGESFAEQVAQAKQNQPAPGDAVITATGESPAGLAQAPEVSAPKTTRDTATLPTIYKVITDGTLVLPDLHLDIHVYSDVPEDRFVFINMSKQRERSQLPEGPVVEEITPGGVVLEYRGTSFLLPRD